LETPKRNPRKIKRRFPSNLPTLMDSSRVPKNSFPRRPSNGSCSLAWKAGMEQHNLGRENWKLNLLEEVKRILEIGHS